MKTAAAYAHVSSAQQREKNGGHTEGTEQRYF